MKKLITIGVAITTVALLLLPAKTKAQLTPRDRAILKYDTLRRRDDVRNIHVEEGYGGQQICWEEKQVYSYKVRDAANHPNAYADGYQEGVQSRANGDTYERRTAGGEFARGFKDGYYGKPYTGQSKRRTVNDSVKVSESWLDKCEDI